MRIDIRAADPASAVAVLLHPHPDHGGNRFHPFIDRLFGRLPGASVSAARFDFTTSSPSGACEQVVSAIDEGAAQWPACPVFLAGYSFGAGIAAMVDDPRVAGWYLLAPVMLEQSVIGDDPRPKRVLIPEHDQFSPRTAIETLTREWQSTSLSTLPDTDHFLGPVEPAVDDALAWIRAQVAR